MTAVTFFFCFNIWVSTYGVLSLNHTITPSFALEASFQSMMSLSQAPNSKNITLHNSTAGSFSDIWGSHSSDCEDWSSLGCNVMSPGRSVGAFQSNLLLSSCVLLFKRIPLTLAPGYLPWWRMKQVYLCSVRTLLTHCMASHPRTQIYAGSVTVSHLGLW